MTATHLTRRTLGMAAALTLATGLAACGSGSGDPLATGNGTTATGAGSGQQLVVGSADFSESAILAEMYAGALRAKGVNASTKLRIGSREIYMRALNDGSIAAIPEYTGALALYLDKNFTETDPQRVYDALGTMLPERLTVLDRSVAEDKDSLTVTRATADSLSATTMEDLQGKTANLVLGAPPEFASRAQGVPGLKATYELTFPEVRALKGQALVQALVNGQVDVANIFTTDPAIKAHDLVVLEDTKRLFGTQNVVPLITKEAATDQVREALNAVSAKLTTDGLRELVAQVDNDKRDAADVAKEWLGANGVG